MGRQKHGMSNTRLYEVWKKIKQRTRNPDNKAYKNYGGRGIDICEEWASDFAAFYQWAMENGYRKSTNKARKEP